MPVEVERGFGWSRAVVPTGESSWVGKRNSRTENPRNLFASLCHFTWMHF